MRLKRKENSWKFSLDADPTKNLGIHNLKPILWNQKILYTRKTLLFQVWKCPGRAVNHPPPRTPPTSSIFAIETNCFQNSL